MTESAVEYYKKKLLDKDVKKIKRIHEGEHVEVEDLKGEDD